MFDLENDLPDELMSSNSWNLDNNNTNNNLLSTKLGPNLNNGVNASNALLGGHIIGTLQPNGTLDNINVSDSSNQLVLRQQIQLNNLLQQQQQQQVSTSILL